MFTAKELRKKYLDFFQKNNHAVLASASLVPENDPSVLFTTAGMHPLVPFLMGEKHPRGMRLVNVQKCLRTDDIDEVGDNTHNTYFEMLGNWSLGDYFKEESITLSFRFLTEELGVAIEKLAVTCFAGDDTAPRDEVSHHCWLKLGIQEARIAFLGKEDNWWPSGGKHPGPQGPDTEIFYWTGMESAPTIYDPADKRWVEIWNNVFMEFNRTTDGAYQALAQQNVDTGMGLERTLMVLNGKTNIYETELFIPIINKIRELAENQDTISERVIADHVRAAMFLLADHVRPSNVDQGYILRRLIRRAVRHGRKMGIKGNFLEVLGAIVIALYQEAYPELMKHPVALLQAIQDEENQFSKTLENGLKQFRKLEQELTATGNKMINGEEAFHLYDTFGFPIEITKELASEVGFVVDEAGFGVAFKKHQELSRQGSEQKFAGGLADHSDESKKLHTATHLLHQALRMVLGPHIEQRGSNITQERLRFDFPHDQAMTAEQKVQVEKIVNEQIRRDLSVTWEELSVDEAKAKGAIGIFEDRYGDRVKVYTMGDFSKEICGGPHVDHTGELKAFKILKEESSSKGIRRIKAVIGEAAL
ncbi:MAG: alanine--tRNA ligase [Candidatus Abawacabacteria bacterium]|nr:alanine--tRNA ligase [Candidatus Abawacabacteria bacterium]